MFAIRFDLPSGETLYAGIYKGSWGGYGWGWADKIEDAEMFATAEEVGKALEQGYEHSAQYAVIVTTEEVTA